MGRIWATQQPFLKDSELTPAVDPGPIGTIHHGRLTWKLQITHLERKMIFQTSMFMVHVNLPGCIRNEIGMNLQVQNLPAASSH